MWFCWSATMRERDYIPESWPIPSTTAGSGWCGWAVALSVSREIAQAEGIEVRRLQFLMYIMIALLVAVMMKVMGVLLIAAMLVIPTTSARLFSRSPEQMVYISGLYGLAALGGGITSSFHFDWQTGPAIVISATTLLLLTLAVTRIIKSREGKYGRP